MSTPGGFFDALFGRTDETPILAPRQAKKVSLWDQLTKRGKERDIRRIQKAEPGVNRRTAARRAAAMRRRGEVPETVTRGTATPAQLASNETYLSRQQAAQRAAQTRTHQRMRGGKFGDELSGKNISIITYVGVNGDLQTAMQKVPSLNFSASDRYKASIHRNRVFNYFSHGGRAGNPKYAEIVKRYRGKGILDHATGQVIPFEYDLDRLDEWYDQTGGMLTPDDFYTAIES